MLFQTLPFFAFFAILYPLYLLTKETRLRLPLLLAASYVFYAWLSPLYLLPLIYATVADYLMLAQMARSRRPKTWLALSIVNSLGVLAFFKYSAFLATNINSALSLAGVAYALPVPNKLLPAGLSFFLLQSIGYVIDVHRGTVPREKSLLTHAAFVSFFPRLLAGPIERAGNLLPQLRTSVPVTLRDFTDGLSIFVVGYFKKVALADYLALYVAKVYGAPGQFRAPALILATFLFAWQIYFDFSGYTDMARGVARMMGIRLMLNFDNPYLASSMGDFWKRWHISLSSWFRDYVYIPLGGNRKGKVATYRNVFLTMVLSGLWHGAAWTYVLWGAVHALGNFATRELERTSFYLHKVPYAIKLLIVLVFVTFAWAFFRAESIGAAGTIIARAFTSGLDDPYVPLLALTLIAAVWAYQFLFASRLRWVLEAGAVRVGLVIAMLVYMILTVGGEGQQFIYMQF
ncbi:MAG: MBOAT family protein [Planctomycetes bacterium]|nr:MBOAT family protein [Planctomycetota bacterium]